MSQHIRELKLPITALRQAEEKKQTILDGIEILVVSSLGTPSFFMLFSWSKKASEFINWIIWTIESSFHGIFCKDNSNILRPEGESA
ncbi:Hypothetical predicted protein [Olea europaea subsp. europaea]|uniref:Uncharacterized protein n=1 Tax=Olea europaea subsp. europaea TaxID=158383 RepID=A0A8S0V0C4_OLEEU|nr:Hypothetical predicted protein [Olea europaea subsp. europaea]